MPLTLKDTDQDIYTVAFTDKKNQPVTSFPAPPVWATSNPAILTVTPAADGFSATVVAVSVGTSQVSATGTNADGTTAVGLDDVTVVASDAVTAGMTAGTPTAQP